MSHFLGSAFVALAIGCSALACGAPDGDYFGEIKSDPDPKHLYFCNSGEPEYLDPALVTSTTGLKVVYAMFDGLTDHNLQGLPEPSLATHWDIAPDQRTFTFHLHDKGRWSNGRQINANDFVYHITRVLHPLTGSKNAETHWKLKNGELFTANRVRMVMNDSALPKGAVVEVLGLDGNVVDPTKWNETELPNPNTRTSNESLTLHEWPRTDAKTYATLETGSEVTIIELSKPNRDWAYIYGGDGDGVYGWVPTEKLHNQPNADVVYTVREVAPEHRPHQTLQPIKDYKGEQKTIAGRDLLMLPEVLGLYTKDDFTLVLETWGPVPYMIDMSPQRAFRPTPREAVSRNPKRWVKVKNIVTSSAFHMTFWRIRDRIELEKSSTYWRAEEVKLDKITVYSINNQAASANLYVQGGCDAVTSNNIPSSYLPVLNGLKRNGKPYKDYTAAPYLGIYLYLINTEKFPNVHFRRALNYAVDRRPIPKITKGGQIPTAQFMPGVPVSQLSDEDLALCGITRDHPGVATVVQTGKLCYVPPQGLDFNVAKAKEELEIARKEMGDKFPTKFTLKFNTGVESHKLIAEWMQQVWQKNLGLEVGLESQEWKTFLKDTVNGEYDVARMGWIGNYPDPEGEFLPQFKSASPDNRTKYNSPEFDRLFKEAEATSDRKQRLALIRRAEEIMVNDAPIIPLYVYTQHHLQKPFVKDLSINPVDQVPLRKAWIDPNWKQNQTGDKR